MKTLLRNVWRWHIAYVFIGPAVILVLGVRFLPALDAIRLSLFDMHLGRPIQYVGLDNYFSLLSDGQLLNNLRVTAIYTVSTVILSFTIGFALALLLQSARAGFTCFRAILFIPYVVAPVVVALMWRWLVDPVQGLFNYFIVLLGGEAIPFLSRPILALVTLIVVAVWSLYPLPMVLLLAGLNSIPGELYSAARVDGVSAWRRFTGITLPLLRPTMFITLTMLTLFAFYAVELPLALTRGGPAHATSVLGVRLYIEAFEYFNRGYASTLGVLILVINVLLVLFYQRIFRSKAYY